MQMSRRVLAVSTAFTLITCLASPGLAGPCAQEIARLQPLVRDSNDNPFIGPTDRQTIGAQLHHQPTPASVERAESQANANAAAVLQRAMTYDAAGMKPNA
jgi:hypothetical protein